MSDTKKRLVIDVLQDARRQLDMSSSKETAEKLAEAIKALDAAVDEAMARDCMSDAAMVARKVGDMRANPADAPRYCNHQWDTNADSGHEDQWPHTCGRHAGHAGVHECSRCEQTNVPTPGVPDRPWNGDRYVPEMVARDSIPGFMPGMGDIKAPTPPPECGITWASAMLDGTRHGHTCGLPSGHEGKHRCRGCPVHVDVVAPPAATTPEPAPKPALVDDPARCPSATRCTLPAGHAGIHVFDPLDCLPTWRPIETAPRDGTVIHLLTAGGAIVMARWTPSFWHFGNHNFSPAGRPGPTHWCPLPVMP